MKTSKKQTPVLVTGASGYIASWVVKYLLEDGHEVHGTVRSLADPAKTAHLLYMQESYPGKLKLFEADLLGDGSFAQAIDGCGVVIHTASPFIIGKVKNPRKQLIEPALEGTRNVLNTVNKTSSVERVVLTSSVVAIHGDAIDIKNVKGGVFTEEYWNTTSSEKHNPYNYSKVIAEREAWEIAEGQSRWRLIVINPGFVVGPALSKRTDAASIDFVRSMVNGKFAIGVPGIYLGWVDVRDVALAHLQAAKLEHASGRHILVGETLGPEDVVGILKQHFEGKYKIPKGKVPDLLFYLAGPMMGFSWKYCRLNLGVPIAYDNSYSKKDLKITYRPVSDSLKENVEQLEKDGLI